MKDKRESSFYARNRSEWRAWLQKNHDNESKIALLKYKKHTGKPSLSHKESMEEAICFGWIDTTIKRIDDDTYIRRFARRTDKSKWSDNTLRYAKELIANGRMTPAGLIRYKEGLSRPTHDYGIPKDPDVPLDLKKALKSQGVWEKFESVAPSVRRMHLRWILRAKQSETRKKRIAAVVSFTEKNKKLGL